MVFMVNSFFGFVCDRLARWLLPADLDACQGRTLPVVAAAPDSGEDEQGYRPTSGSEWFSLSPARTGAAVTTAVPSAARAAQRMYLMGFTVVPRLVRLAVGERIRRV